MSAMTDQEVREKYGLRDKPHGIKLLILMALVIIGLVINVVGIIMLNLPGNQQVSAILGTVTYLLIIGYAVYGYKKEKIFFNLIVGAYILELVLSGITIWQGSFSVFEKSVTVMGFVVAVANILFLIKYDSDPDHAEKLLYTALILEIVNFLYVLIAFYRLWPNPLIMALVILVIYKSRNVRQQVREGKI
jgi:hypothetical protein